ncbi:hypothetical protein LX32DRAFT_375619 [Colletotrichum zoysiae]|uniref:Uncharacterized protein n=1 Tax=Colletotrichum zoysiae TaxID=1216348 RepID=A0AAD9M522_9PEZI|nr:hypothetical protein LX32DRAFT_375619 [Colletotrichum zoysiae]
MRVSVEYLRALGVKSRPLVSCGLTLGVCSRSVKGGRKVPTYLRSGEVGNCRRRRLPASWPLPRSSTRLQPRLPLPRPRPRPLPS